MGLDEHFQSTSWSIIAAARDEKSAAARAALDALCRQYWQPLYTYVRLKGHGPDEARELTQEFFTRLLARDFLENVDEAHGKFRAFLLACMNNFLSKARREQRAERRGGGLAPVPLDFDDGEERFTVQASGTLDPGMAFDRQWAEATMESAARKLAEEYRRAGKADVYQVLSGYLGRVDNPPSYEDAAAQIGLSEGATRVAVHRLRKRFAALTRQQIAETVETEAEIQEELDYLIQVLSS